MPAKHTCKMLCALSKNWLSLRRTGARSSGCNDASFERFGLPPEQPASVAVADDLMLAVEYRDLMTHLPDEQYIASPPAGVTVSIREPWPPESAEREFLSRFERLFPR